MRSSGILMPISSLPGPFGIGTVGKSAYKFVDFLKKAGQSVWQILPVSPTGFGDSPYQSCSAFAGNPYFIDLDLLCQKGLLKRSEYAKLDWGKNEGKVDYALLYRQRYAVLRLAFERFSVWYPDEYYQFCYENRDWIEDYALYMTIKQNQDMKHYLEWPQPLRDHEKAALDQIYATQEKEVHFWKFLQFEFFRQWKELKAYANAAGVKILGDIPIYVAMDSADVWANPSLFWLDAGRRPVCVAGCPPDYFSAKGQLWGNPLYDWEAHRATGYDWWMGRLSSLSRFFDVVRIDHFRGFEAYYAIPWPAEDAVAGSWKKGPGMDFFRTVKERLGALEVVAEDLGYLTPEVHALLEETGYPGMKVLQFAFRRQCGQRLPPHNHAPEQRGLRRHPRQQHRPRLAAHRPQGKPETGQNLPGPEPGGGLRRGHAPGCAELSLQAGHHLHGRLAGPGQGRADQHPLHLGRQLDLAGPARGVHRGSGQIHPGQMRPLRPGVMLFCA